MSVRPLSLAAVMIVLSSAAMAQSAGQDDQDACRADVRRFCYKIDPSEGDGAFLRCLQEHRAKLHPRCRAVLESHGV